MNNDEIIETDIIKDDNNKTNIINNSNTTLLLKLAEDLVETNIKNKIKNKITIVEPCFLDYIPHPINNPQSTININKSNKKEIIEKYEQHVLNHFFVFDNSSF